MSKCTLKIKNPSLSNFLGQENFSSIEEFNKSLNDTILDQNIVPYFNVANSKVDFYKLERTDDGITSITIDNNKIEIDPQAVGEISMYLLSPEVDNTKVQKLLKSQTTTNFSSILKFLEKFFNLKNILPKIAADIKSYLETVGVPDEPDKLPEEEVFYLFPYRFTTVDTQKKVVTFKNQDEQEIELKRQEFLKAFYKGNLVLDGNTLTDVYIQLEKDSNDNAQSDNLTDDKFGAVMVPYVKIGNDYFKLYIKKDQTREGLLEVTTNLSEALAFGKNKKEGITFRFPNFDKLRGVKINPKVQGFFESIKAAIKNNNTPSLGFYKATRARRDRVSFKQAKKETVKEFESRLSNPQATISVAEQQDEQVRKGGIIYTVNGENVPVFELPLNEKYVEGLLDVIDLARKTDDTQQMEQAVESLKKFYNYTGSDILINFIDGNIVVSSKIKIVDRKVIPLGKYVPVTDRETLRGLMRVAKVKIRKEQVNGEDLVIPKVVNNSFDYNTKVKGLDWVKEHLYTNALPTQKVGETTLTYEPDYSFIIDVGTGLAPSLQPSEDLVTLNLEGGDLKEFIERKWKTLFEADGVNLDTKRLAELIFALSADTNKLDGWTITFVPDFDGGIADFEKKEIRIGLQGDIPLLITEEVSHALTTDWLLANQESAEYKRLQEIANQIDYVYEGAEERTPIELLAKLGDPEIVDKLIKAKKSRGKVTLLDEIKGILKNIFEKLFKGFNRGLYKEMASLYLTIATREVISLPVTEENIITEDGEDFVIVPLTSESAKGSKRSFSSSYQALLEDFNKQIEEEYGKQFVDTAIQTLTGDLVDLISLVEKNDSGVLYSNIPNLLNGNLDFNASYRELLGFYSAEFLKLKNENKLDTPRGKFLKFVLGKNRIELLKEVFKQKNKVFEIKADKTLVSLEQEDELKDEQAEDTSTLEDRDLGNLQEEKEQSQQVLEGGVGKEHIKKEPNKFNFEQADKKVRAFIKLLPQMERDDLTGFAKVYTEEQVDKLIEEGVPGSRFFPYRQNGVTKYVRAAETEMGAIRLTDTMVTWSTLSKLFAGKFSIEDMLDYGYNNINRVLREVPEFLAIEPYLNSKLVTNLDQNQLVIKFESAFKRYENPLYIVLNNDGVRTVINESADIFPIVTNQVNNTLRGYVISDPAYQQFYDQENDTLNIKDLLLSFGLELGNLATYPRTEEERRLLLAKLGFVFTKDIVANNKTELDNFFLYLMNMLKEADATQIPIEIADFITTDHKITTPSGTKRVKGISNKFKEIYRKQNEYTPFNYSIMSPNAEGELQSAYSIPNSILQDAALLSSLNHEGSPTTKETIEKFIPRSNNPTFKASLFYNMLFGEEGNRTTDTSRKPINLEVVNWNGEKITEEGSASRGRLNVDLDNYSKILFDFVGLLTQGLHENTRAQVSSTSYAIRLSNYQNSHVYPIPPSEAKELASTGRISKSSLLFQQFVKYFNAAIEEAKAVAQEKGIPVDIPVMFSKDFAELLPEDERLAFFTTPINLKNETQTDKFERILVDFFTKATIDFSKDMDKAGLSNLQKDGLFPPAIQKLLKDEYVWPDIYALYVINSYVIRTEEIILFQGSHERIGTKKAKYFKRANTVQSTRLPITGSAKARAFLNEQLKDSSFASRLNLDSFALGDTYRTTVLEDVVEASTPGALYDMNNGYQESAKKFYKKIKRKVSDKEISEAAANVERQYKKVTISDGQAIINPDAYIAFRMGIGGDSNLLKAHKALSLDMIYNQEIYFSPEEINDLGLPSKDSLTEAEIKEMREGMKLLDSGKVVFPTLKWTHRGSTKNQSGVANEVLDKFSMFPLYIQYVYNKPQLKNQFLSMLKTNTAYVKFESGTKLDTVSKPIGISATSTLEEITAAMQEQGYELLSNNLGEQITTPVYAKTTTVFGSQFRKLIVQALSLLGKDDLSLGWDKSVQAISNSIKDSVLADFGVVDGRFENVDLAKIARILKENSITKELTDNVIEFLKKMEEGNYPYMEANLSQKDIQNLIAGVVKRVAVQKVHGSQLIQVSSALDHFSDRLSWYKLGKPAECKVSMMGDFLNLLNLPEVEERLLNVPLEERNTLVRTRILNELLKDPNFVKKHEKVLKIATYRIPTQGLNSMDVFIIKEFLPHFQAPQIILPPEAVVKSGTDYDYDKAPAIFPRIDALGRFQSEENSYLDLDALEEQKDKAIQAIYEKYKPLLREARVSEEQINIREIREKLSTELLNIAAHEKSLKDRQTELASLQDRLSQETDPSTRSDIEFEINNLNKDILNFTNLIQESKQKLDSFKSEMKTVEEKGVETEKVTKILEDRKKEIGNILRLYYNALDVFKSYKPARLNQNKVLESAIDILLLPENYFILITPNSTNLIFDPLESFFQRFYPPNFREEPSGSQIASHKSNFQKFKVVKMSDLLGIAATTNTLYTLFQNYKEKINRTYKVKIGKKTFERSIPNKLTNLQQSEQYLDTLNPFTEDGALKSEVLSQLINVTVDAPGDDRFGYTNFNLNNFGAALYLVYAHSVPFEKILYFFHHPAVLKYEEYLQKMSTGGKRPNKKEVSEFLKGVFGIESIIPLESALPFLAENLDYSTIESRFQDAQAAESFQLDSDMADADKAVLAYYLMVLDASEQVRLLNSSINFDRSPDNILMKHIGRIIDLKNVVISDIVSKEFLEKIFTDSMISGVYTNDILSGLTNRLFPALFNSENVEAFAALSEDVYNQEKFIIKVTNDFLLSIIQNFAKIVIDDKEFKLDDIAADNLMGKKKYKLAAKAIELHKRFEKEALDIRLLRIITNSPSKTKEIVNVRIFRGFEDKTEDRNRLISEFRFLLNHPDEKIRSFAINLAATGLIQSGYSKSPLFFSDLIPEEFISPILTNAVNEYLDTVNKENYALQFSVAFRYEEGRLFGSKNFRPEAYRLKFYTFEVAKSGPTWLNKPSTEQLLRNLVNKQLGTPTPQIGPRASTIEISGTSLPVVGEVTTPASTVQNKNIKFEEEQTPGYKNRTIKNASADATIAIAVDFNSAGEKLTKSSVLDQGKKYIALDANNLTVTQERVDKIVNELNSISSGNYEWNRYSDNSYEVSSEGDRRFSALFAKLKDGRTIEEAYQLDIKGYRTQGNDWKLGKGKPPIRNIGKEQQWNEYKDLWRNYLNENPELLKDLQEKAKGKTLTDKFASTDISQARALAEILNEKFSKGITLNIAGNGIYTMKGKYTQQQVDDFTYELLNRVINSPNLKTKIESIRTGGQTGFDEAGTKAGIRLGLPTLTLAPKGWTFRNSEGKDISDEQQFKARFESVVTQEQTSIKLFNPNDKVLKKGSVVEYKNSKYLFWNLNAAGKAQLINTDGTKAQGTPLPDKLTVLGSYPTTIYNNTEYIVTDNNNVYSGATGNLVYAGDSPSEKVQKQRIIEQAKNPSQPPKLQQDENEQNCNF